MKQSKLVVILLVFLIICGWMTALLTLSGGEKEEYNSHITMAEEYIGRGLYQKAIEEYDAAILIKNTEDVWALKLDAYQNRYDESTKIYDEYLSAAQNAVTLYSDNVDFILNLANLYIIRNEYYSAYKVLNNAIESGVESDKIRTLLLDVKYAYEMKWKAYTGYLPCSNGFYAVEETGIWTYITEDGTDTDFEQLVFAGAVGELGIRVVNDREKSYLIDEKFIVQGILNFEPTAAGVFSEELIAIKDNKSYSYYNSLGDKQFGGYESAGAFYDGIAAVQKNGVWFLIDKEGKIISPEKYEDIIIHDNGTHIMNGMMIAKKDGVYSFYKDGKVYGSYLDCDIITEDGIIAVCKKEGWGFVDIEGKEIIPCKFKKAKSFSNGLAAVYDGERWGFIDPSGNIVIDCIFFDADYFNSKGCCIVETGEDTSWQLISLYVK